MNTIRTNLLVGVFHDRERAQRALDRLLAAGFQPNQIGVITNQPDPPEGGRTPAASGAAKGATVGAVAGAGAGALFALGLAAQSIPPLGLAVGGSLLALFLGGVGTGAAVGAVTGMLLQAGLTEDEARAYEAAVAAGRTLLTVSTADRAAEARAILDEYEDGNATAQPPPAAPAPGTVPD